MVQNIWVFSPLVPSKQEKTNEKKNLIKIFPIETWNVPVLFIDKPGVYHELLLLGKRNINSCHAGQSHFNFIKMLAPLC